MQKLLAIFGSLFLLGILAVGGLVVYDIYQKGESSQPQSPAVVVLPSGEQITVNEETITPKSTIYQGQGVSYSREVHHIRMGSAFGVSPGESLSRQNPAVINTGPAPSINITPDGIQVGEGSAVQFKGGSGRYGVFDGIIQWIKDWGLTLIIIAAVAGLLFIVIPVIFPAAAPIISGIWNGIKTFFMWLIPIFGGMWTWIKLHVFHIAATQIIQGNETFKSLIQAEPTFTDDVKARVLTLFSQSHDANQDTSTQAVVKTIKMQLK